MFLKFPLYSQLQFYQHIFSIFYVLLLFPILHLCDRFLRKRDASGIKAGDIIKAIAPICGGKGGGKPDSAMGGGTEVSKVDDALAAVDDLILSKLG